MRSELSIGSRGYAPARSAPEDLASRAPTQMRTARWECGSDFHLESFPPSGAPTRYPWSDQAWFGGSGRDVLRALLHFGQRTRGWRRLWFPSYFCQKVLKSALSVGLEVRLYPDSPFRDPDVTPDLPLRAGDAVFIPNCFGLRAANWLTTAPTGVELIEDHSHDLGSLWAWRSTADWCIGSLRKTLPLSDGGVIWSPRGHPLPPPATVTRHRHEAASGKLAAMALKALYLAGHPIDKELYRSLAAEAEGHIADEHVSGMTPWSRAMLNAFPLQDWRRARRANHDALTHALASVPRCRWIMPDDRHDDVCPFAATLLCDTPHQRDRLHAALVAQRVYAAILWPLDNAAIAGIPDEDRSAASRMLSFSCDHRYSADDMERVAAVVEQAFWQVCA